MNTLRSHYPPIDPYAAGFLDVGDGHCVYWERIGTPGAKPAVFLHGGPGGAISPDHRRLFDPDLYDVLLFDQRGCGRSKPYAALNGNTTWDLVADIERLRNMVGVDRWLVFGGSWGSTLALCYAEKHVDRVSELILRGVCLLNKQQMDWYFRKGASEMFPDEWERFISVVPLSERQDLITAYRTLLSSENHTVKLAASKAWSRWEDKTASLLSEVAESSSPQEDELALVCATIENHFFVHNGWLAEGQLIEGASMLAGIPGVIVHGRYDIPCPVRQAWELHQVWKNAELHIVEAAGHSYGEPGILDRLIYATDKFAKKTGV